MAKKNKMNLGVMFSAAAIIADGNPDAFMTILKCFVHAAQPDVPHWNHSSSPNDEHAAKARLLTRTHK